MPNSPLLWMGQWVLPEDESTYKGGSISLSFDLFRATIDNVLVEDITDSLIDGSVSLDVTQALPRSASFNIRNPLQVNPYADYLAPFLNMDFEDDRKASIHQQIGLYSTQVSPGTFTVEDAIGTIQGMDLCSVLASDRFTKAYNIASGSNVVDAVISIIQSAGITNINIPRGLRTTTKDRSFHVGDDKLTSCNQLLRSIGYYTLSTGLNGRIYSAGLTQRLNLIEPTYTMRATDIMAPIELTPTNDRICNVAVVTNTDNKDTPLKSVQKNTDPDSPTSIPSLGINIVKFESMSGTDVTQADVDARAIHLLDQGRTYYRTANINILPRYQLFRLHTALELDLEGEADFLSGKWWINTVSMGFTPANALMVLGLNQLTHRDIGQVI